MKKIFVFMLIGLMLISSVACNTTFTPGQLVVTNPPIHPSDSPAMPMPTQVPVAMDGSFDEALTAFLDKRMEGNYMISSLSLKYALGLLIEGADGETRDELIKALGMTEEEFHAFVTAFNAFVKAFAEYTEEQKILRANYPDAGEPDWALEVANSIWKRDNITEEFKEEYKELIEGMYSAEYNDFTKENFPALVNAWCKEKTHGMIPQLVPDGYDTSNLAVVLMNALYFKSAWTDKFDDAKPGDFTTASGQAVSKDFLSKIAKYKYYSDENTQLVCMPMEGNVDMVFVLGDKTNIQDKIANATVRTVDVHIPKLDIDTSFNNQELVDFLIACGVKFAFNPDYANFGNMTDHKPLFIGDIIQKTKLKLDENGVEAAAVTAIMMMNATSIDADEPVIFDANQPFSFFIIGGNTVMFNGRVVE